MIDRTRRHARSPLHPTTRAGWLLLTTLALAALTVGPAAADPFPPYWSGGSGPAVHFAPVAWPANGGDGELDYGDWTPYTLGGADTEDQGVQDPSNGGTSPQNYANVSSGCTDLTLPSIFYAYDTGTDTFFFRWRVEQIAHTYATGPNAGTFSSSNPWNSALWTVFFDIDGDGYREFAFHIDGSSGSPSTPIDQLVAIYSDTPSQSIDYIGDPQICRLYHNPTAFVDGATDRILNFQNSVTPTTGWINGVNEMVWDYGTTRAVQVNHTTCTEYFIDYQIPLAMLDATASSCGGPAVTESTPMSLSFATGNSLNDPLQKDVVFQGCFNSDPNNPMPGGDVITPGGGGGASQQPTVTEVSATGCGPTALSATVMDHLDVEGCGNAEGTIASVDFYAYFDTDGDGLADDGNSWSLVDSASPTATIGQWTGNWDSSGLPSGFYLIGVRAEDDDGNVTWSYLTPAEVAGLGSPPNYANPDGVGIVTDQFVNSCGTSPSLTKSASVSEVAAGGTVDFTLTVAADSLQALNLSSLTDALPAGWTYVSNQGGTLTPTSSPIAGASGNITWTFAPQVIPAGASRTLIFRAQAPASTGSFTNSASAATSQGTLDSNNVPINVGAPRLTIAKTVNQGSAAPGDVLVYTITYANDSPINVTNATIVDTLPDGVTFVSATGGGTHDGGTPGTVTWSLGNLNAGSGAMAVTLTVTVDDPFTGDIPFINIAEISSDQTAPASDTASVFVSQPLTVQKRSTTNQVLLGNDVTYTIDYANTGGSSLASSTITDAVPTGWTFRSYACGAVTAPGGCALTSAPAVGGTGTVTWTISNLPAGGSGTVTLVLRPVSVYTGSNPSTNTATFTSGALSVFDSYDTAITQQAMTCPTSTYYFKNTLIDEGVDTAGNVAPAPLTPGNQRSADQAIPVGAATIVPFAPTSTTVPIEVARWYSDPVQSTVQSHDGPVTAQLWVTKGGGTPVIMTMTAWDYDPVTGATTQIGSAQSIAGNGNLGTVLLPFTFNATGVLPTGHRMLWIFSALKGNNGTNPSIQAEFGGVGRESLGTICLSPVVQNLNKYASPIVALPGSAVTFTLPLGNASRVATTGNVLTETLPAGLTFVSATATGGTVTQTSVVGQTRTFQVTSTGQPAGTIAAGTNVTVTINATVDGNAPAGVLTNTATLSSNEADPVTDTAAVTITRPSLQIEKAASDTLLPVGGTTTYTLTIGNFGNGASTNINVTDPLPSQTYYSYVGPCNTNAGSTGAAIVCTPSGVPTNSLGITVNQLDPGESVTVSYDMTVSGMPPAGLSDHPNTASGYDTFLTSGSPVSSNTVIVTISTAPNLQLAKSTTAVSPVATGEVITYTIVASNTGSADALDVEVADAIPANTTYVPGSLTYEAAGQTDAADGDFGSYSALGEEVFWAIGTLPMNSSRTMTFQVVVDSVLDAGSTAIPNTAIADSSNGGQRTASADLTAEAAPAWSLLKSAPSQLAFPLTLLNGAQGPTTTLNVDSTNLLSTGDMIAIAGSSTVATITGLTATTITVDTPLSGADNAQVRPAIEYTVRYTNTGDAAASGVVITDALPAGSTFVSASDGGVHGGGSPGTVTWTIGTVAAGATEIFDLVVLPGGTGTYQNDFTVASNELPPTDSNTTTTSVGALEPTKSTSTPLVSNTPSGSTATYTLTVVNNSGTQATNVTLTDTFESGFSYASTTSTTGGTRTLTTNPTAGANPATWCCWTLNAGATLTINFNAAISDQVGDGTYQNGLAVSSDNVAALEFDPLSTTAEDVTVDYSGPNHVIVSWFEAYADGDDVVLRWETDAEVGTLGFRILRLDREKGIYESVHEKLLPGLITSPQGGVYSLIDPGAARDGEATYLLVELEASGQEHRYGPMQVAVAPSREVLGLPADFGLSGGEGLAERKSGQRFAKLAHPRRETPAVDHRQDKKKPASSSLPSGLRLGVAANGLHQVDASEIASVTGVQLKRVQKLIQNGRLRITVDGRQVAWLDVDGSGTAVQFYGEATDSDFSRDRIYRLELMKGKKISSLDATPGAAISGQTFRDTRRIEKDTRPLVVGPLDVEGELWFWDYLQGNSPAKAFDLGLESPAANGTDAILEVVLQGASNTGATTHRVAVSLNGQALGSVDFAGYQPAIGRFSVPATLLVGGNNRVELRAELRPGAGSSLVFLDRFAVEYDRSYRTSETALTVRGGGHPNVTVDGLPATGARVFDITNPRLPKLLTGTVASNDGSGHGVRFATSAQRPYHVATPAAVRRPTISADYRSSLLAKSNDYDYLVIAPSSMLQGAERLAELRRARGLSALVVSLDDVMDELNGGQFDPDALRDFLAWTQVEWSGAPRYAALAGEGHFDYLDVWATGGNPMPPLLLAGSWGLYASDNHLADADGDGFPELAIGRIPVTSAAQLDAYVDKLAAYEAAVAAGESWTGRAMVVADNSDSTGRYSVDSHQLADRLGVAPDDRLYLGPLSTSEVNDRLLAGLESGAGLVTYLGHGGLTTLAAEGILRSADVPGLTNGSRAPVMALMACHLGNFAIPGYPSLAEDLVLHGDGGAVAVWTPAGISYNPHRRPLAEAFVEGLQGASGPVAVGDLVLEALRAGTAGRGAAGREIVESQVLLGDPAALLAPSASSVQD